MNSRPDSRPGRRESRDCESRVSSRSAVMVSAPESDSVSISSNPVSAARPEPEPRPKAPKGGPHPDFQVEQQACDFRAPAPPRGRVWFGDPELARGAARRLALPSRDGWTRFPHFPLLGPHARRCRRHRAAHLAEAPVPGFPFWELGKSPLFSEPLPLDFLLFEDRLRGNKQAALPMKERGSERGHRGRGQRPLSVKLGRRAQRRPPASESAVSEQGWRLHG